MNKTSILIFSCLLLCFCCPAQKKVTSKPAKSKPKVKLLKADWQVIISPAKDTKESEVGYVEVFPYGNSLDSAKFAVTDKRGKRVNAKLLWAAPGEPMKILFDNSSKAKSYKILFGNNIPKQKADWEPEAGLILETKKRAPGNANNWKEAKQVIDHSTTVEGRSQVDKIFHGINPHGPSKDLVVHFQGYLNIKKPGNYRFAIAADDAVFLFVDGRKITEWPGWHGPWEGTRGKFSGDIKLKKGIHRLDYYNVQNGYGLNLVCGWKPPWRKHLEIIPPDAFVALKHYKITNLEYKGKNVPAYFSWKPKEHLMVDEKAIVNMDLATVKPLKDLEYRWYFDDFRNARGSAISHLFLSPGLRKIRIEVKKKGKKVDQVENLVKVSPRWLQREEWPKHVEKSLRKQMKRMDYSKLPPKDLTNWAEILNIIEKRNLLASIGKVILKRKKEFADNPQLFYILSQCYIHYSIRGYDLAEQAYRACLEYAGNNFQLCAKSKLFLGALYIHNYGKCDEGIKLLNEVDEKHLASFDKRKRQIWLADGYMTKGDMETVEKIYSKLPDVVNKKDRRNTILNEARVLNALDYLRRGAYDDAEKMVWQVEWQYPYEAMKSQTGLVMTKVFIKRREYNYALWRCMRMMNAAQNSRQMSDIMLTLIEIYDLTGKKKESKALSAKLLKEYPYSEAAATLKAK